MSTTNSLARRLGGESRFITDILPSHLIFGITIRATITRGQILSITLPELPEGYHVVSCKEIPGPNKLILFGKVLPVLVEKEVSYLGEPILLLGGPSKSRLKELATKIKIEYREEDPVLDLEAVLMNSLEDHVKHTSHDIGNAFSEAAGYIRTTYNTALQTAYNIESECAIAIPDKHQLLIYSSCHHPFAVRDNIAVLLGIPKKKVRVIVPENCAPLGGKIIVSSLIAAHVALLAHKSQSTVKMEYTPAEDIGCGVKKYPFVIHWESAMDKEGALTANRIDIQIEYGSRNIFSRYLTRKILDTAARYYKCPAMEVHLTFNATNKAPMGGFSGIGEAELCFAAELQTNKIARQFHFDPFTWKLKNLPARDLQSGAGAVLERVVQLSDFKRKHGSFAALNDKQSNPFSQKRPVRGIGLALCPHTMTAGSDMVNPVFHMDAVLGQDRKLRLKTSAIDLGDSKSTLFANIAARILDIHISEVTVEQVDTFHVPDSGSTLGTTAVTILARLVADCCTAIKQRLKKELPPIAVQKKFIPRPHKGIPETTWEAAVAEVEINPITFEILCRGIWVVVDAGYIVNPDIARNHLEIAALQNYQSASLDESDIIQPAYYALAGALDVPPLHIEFIEPGNGQADKARSLGDQPVCCVAPAFIGAVSQACARDIDFIPATPELIQALQVKNENRI